MYVAFNKQKICSSDDLSLFQVIMDSTKHFKDPDRLKIAKNKHKKHK
jgi:hypothetical protein